MKLESVIIFLAVYIAVCSAVALPGKKCPLGIEYQDQCNTCHCDLTSGRSVCTSMACGVQLDKIKCPKGESYYDGCNNCNCNPSTGISSCTERGCAIRKP